MDRTKGKEHPRTGTRWWNPKKKGWPKMVVDKPYSDIDPLRGLFFMPRIIAPTRALKLKMRMLGFW